MTQPIQEPTPGREVSGLGYGSRQLFRRPSPVPSSSGENVWAFISTEPNGFESSGADDWIDYYSLYISDEGLSGGWFDYECDPNAGQFGDNRAFLLMFQSGVYTFTQQLLTSDLNDTQPEFAYQTRLNVLGGDPGSTGGGEQFTYPGQTSATPLLQDREQLYIDDSSGDDLWLNRSWTIPIWHPDPGDPKRTGEMRLSYTDQPGSSNEFWSVRVWIVRHGDLDFTSQFDEDAYIWSYGDPCTS